MATETQSAAYQAFHERIHANHMYGLWELASQMTAHPTPKMVPYMWRWSLFESVLAEAGTVVPIGDERRALGDDEQHDRRHPDAAAGRDGAGPSPYADGHPLHHRGHRRLHGG